MSPATNFSSGTFLRSVQRLELSALEALHDTFFPKLYRYALYSLGERAASREIASDVFLKLVGQLRQGVQAAQPAGLVVCGRRRAGAGRIQDLFLGRSSEMAVEQGEQGKYGSLFRRSLHKLSPEQQQFLALRFSQKATLQVIAGWLGKQELELRSLQFRSLNALLGALGGKPITQAEESMERALQVCLQNLGGGSRLDEISASYPKWSQHCTHFWRRLIFRSIRGGSTRQQTNPLAGMENLQAAQDRSKAEFLQAAQVSITQPQPGRTGRWLVVSMAVLLLIAACGLAMAALSANSVPGNALYGVQRVSKSCAGADPVSLCRLEVQLLLDQRRLDEVNEMLDQGLAGAVVFSGVLEQNQGERWQVGGVPV